MDIKDLAVKYLGYRARTGAEVRKHLKEKGFDSQEIEETILSLEEYKYIDDSAYCLQYFDYGFGKGKGLRRVKQELEQKGVDRETIELALEEYQPTQTEEERAHCQAEKVVGGKEPDDKLLAKIGRKLNSLGYSSEIVYRVIGTYMRNKDE